MANIKMCIHHDSKTQNHNKWKNSNKTKKFTSCKVHACKSLIPKSHFINRSISDLNGSVQLIFLHFTTKSKAAYRKAVILYLYFE